MTHPGVLAAVVVALLTTAAQAVAEAPVVVIGETPEGWSTVRQDCVDPASGEVAGWQVAPHFGPGATTGSGEGSILLRAGGTDVEGVERTFPKLSELTSLAAHVYEEAGSEFAYRVVVDTGDGLRSLVYRPEPLDPPAWHDTIPVLPTDVWTIYDGLGTAAPLGTTTLFDYQNLHPDAPFTIGVLSWGCDAESVTYIDQFRVEVNGLSYFYDFEPESASMSLETDRTVVTFGQPVTVSGSALDVRGDALDAPVRLIGSPGEHLPFEVGALRTTDGVAQLVHKPRFTTSYRWWLSGEGTHGAAVSRKLTVGVRSRVSGTLADTTVLKGQRIRVTGKVAPGWKGLDVTLWRRTSGGRVRLGSTRTDAHYAYVVRSSVISSSRAATWRVYVAVDATEDNLPGRTAILSVAVN